MRKNAPKNILDMESPKKPHTLGLNEQEIQKYATSVKKKTIEWLNLKEFKSLLQNLKGFLIFIETRFFTTVNEYKSAPYNYAIISCYSSIFFLHVTVLQLLFLSCFLTMVSHTHPQPQN